jgi:predicted O-linked N-acetylglucosamine transferase (SPINDLY family)
MTTVAQALAIALEHHQAGRLQDAEPIYRQILAAVPNEPTTIHLLGVLVYQQGQLDVAVELISRAIALQPTDGAFHNSLGNVFTAQAKLDEAVACYRRAVELLPDYAVAYYNLANIWKAQAKPDEAIAAYRRALELMPDLAAAHTNLGGTLRTQGQLDEAADCFRRALELSPDLPEAHRNLGNALHEQGKLDEAVACYRRALELKPDDADTLVNLGIALRAQGRADEAIACQRRALELKPDNVIALTNLGNGLQVQRLLEEAVACYRRALELKPGHALAHNNLGTALKDQGKLDEALASYSRAVELQPNFAEAQSNLLYTLYFCPGYDAHAIYAAHRRWNQQLAEPLAKDIQPHANDPSPDRRLRIGYVSPDFRDHVVTHFLLPLLESHDRELFEIYCYSSVSSPDAMTDRCRAQAGVWRNVVGRSDGQLADTVREDRIDILVDLSMHMAGNRLLAFARKPAPVQVTYLAYAGTTGLSTMDYRLTDPHLDPPGDDPPAASEPIYSETSIHLPKTYWCYRPPVETPGINALPALRAGHVTFGCLNNFCKVTEPTLAAWASLLQAMPTARLLLHAHPGSHRDRVRSFFAGHHVASERLTFAEMAPLGEYYRRYQGIDVALDPFPYGGGTTTCDALWMGVPVVSLAGQTAVGRGGLSILSNLGLADWVARDCEQYVRIARQSATDLARLSKLRATLRERMQGSPLTDAPRFARHVESAYRAMWRRWCQRRS